MEILEVCTIFCDMDFKKSPTAKTILVVQTFFEIPEICWIQWPNKWAKYASFVTP